ncbi:MAG: carboxypeptidase regulatory-like domain-containing protein [Bryobacterales bacterium]|nr:carboxypeptidase regulatory-like domain-containing protein [Bryobacterales bacterium]
MPARRLTAVLAAVAMTLQQSPVWAQAGAGAPPAIKITVREGDGALNNIRTQQAKDPVIIVTDMEGRPVAGAQVTFTTPDLGATGVFPTGNSVTVVTGPDGTAIARGMKPNNVVGQFQIRVSAVHAGQTVRVALNQTNAAPQKSGGGGGKTALLVAILGGAAAGVAVGVTRSGNKTNSPSTPSGTSISAGGSTFGPPR